MKDRIKYIMEQENLTAAKFADRLQISRAIISHILNGRNNPSLDVVTRILSEMSYINPEWLLNGEGSVYKDGVDLDTLPAEPDLFHQEAIKPQQEDEPIKLVKEDALKPPVIGTQLADNKNIETTKQPPKKIVRIIVYYNDQTFEVFSP